MVETTLEIRFGEDRDASVDLESTAESDAAKQAEIVLFCHYVVWVFRGLRESESARPLAHSLALLEDASAEYLLDFVQRGDPVLGTGGTSVKIVRPEDAAPARTRLVVRQRLLSGRKSPRIFFTVKPKGFGLRDEGVDRALAMSVLVLLYWLLKRRAEDTVYLRQLARAAAYVGRVAEAHPAVLANEVGVVLAAADAGWTGPLAEVRPTGSGNQGTTPDSGTTAVDGDLELECPACGNRASTESGDSSFDHRVWPDPAARLWKCGKCGGGVWVRDGSARSIAPDAWRGIEGIRRWFESGDGHVAEAAEQGGEPRGTSLFDSLKSAFIQHDWPFSEVRAMPILLTELSGPLGTWKFYGHVVEEQSLILFYSICPLTVPADRRVEMANFLTRANYALAMGNFELDFTDGEIRYKTVLGVEGTEVSPVLVKRLIRANGIAMETYLPGIDAVLSGTPALRALEQRTDG